MITMKIKGGRDKSTQLGNTPPETFGRIAIARFTTGDVLK
jgi:hypothetical protein